MPQTYVITDVFGLMESQFNFEEVAAHWVY